MNIIFRKKIYCIIFLLSFTLFNCSTSKKEVMKGYKSGTFKIITAKNQVNFIERYSDFQLKYPHENNEGYEFSKLEWKSNTTYNKEVINKKNKLDSLIFKVKIDSFSNNGNHYETTFIREVSLKTSSKLIKVNDSVSSRLMKLIKLYNKLN